MMFTVDMYWIGGIGGAVEWHRKSTESAFVALGATGGMTTPSLIALALSPVCLSCHRHISLSDLISIANTHIGLQKSAPTSWQTQTRRWWV